MRRGAVILAAALVAGARPAGAACTPQAAWQQAVAGSGSSSQPDGYRVATDPSGNVYVAGGLETYNGSSSVTFLLKKYAAADGSLLWEKTFGSSSSSPYRSGVAIGQDGKVLEGDPTGLRKYYPDGNPIGTAASVTGVIALAPDTTTTIFYYDWRAGNLDKRDGTDPAFSTPSAVWSVYNATYSSQSFLVDLAVDGLGHVVAGIGQQSSGTGTWAIEHHTPATGAMDAGWPVTDCGNLLGIAVDSSRNVIAVGTSCSGSGATNGWIVRKYSENGTKLWEKAFEGTNFTSGAGSSDLPGGRGVAVDAAGNIYVAGMLFFTPCSGNTTAQTAGHLFKLDPSGNQILRLPMPATSSCSSDRWNGVAVDASGNIALTGQTNVCGSGSCDQAMYTARFTQLANCDEEPLVPGILQIRNNIVHRDRGEAAYLTVEAKGLASGAGSGGDVTFYLYGVSGRLIGKIGGMVMPVTGTGEFRFDGSLEGKALENGIYWVVANSDHASGRARVVLLGMSGGN